MKLVYLHGFASGPQSSKASFFRERLAETGRELNVPDLADGDFEHLTITRQMEVIEREVGGEPSVLIGSSMGGYLAALFAASHSEVSRLILLAPAFGFAQRWPGKLGPDVVANWQRTGVMNVFHYGLGREVPVWWHLIEDGLLYPPEPDFAQPALIFHGTRDEVVLASFSETFAAVRSNTELRLLESDHQLTDQTDIIWADTRAFLGL